MKSNSTKSKSSHHFASGNNPLSLKQLFSDATFHHTDDILVTNYTTDSRCVQANDTFIALRGTDADGHDHILDAISKGATSLIVEQNNVECNIPTCVVPNTQVAFGILAHTMRNNPASILKTIGITGTNGKTTTAYLIAAILEEAGFEPGILGTLGYCDRKDLEPANWTTPPADVLADWLQRMVKQECSHAVMEVSSHALSQSRLSGMELDIACLTNVQSDHLDYHKTKADYLQSKAKIFNQLSMTGMGIVNADDPGCRRILPHLDFPILTVGIDNQAEIQGDIIEQSVWEQTFLITAGNETVPVCSNLIGTHNLYNCLIATAVGLVYGIELTTIARGLEKVTCIPGRLEKIIQGQPFQVMVDYAHTPDGLSQVLQTLHPLTEGKLICVFGAGGDRDRHKRPVMGAIVEQLSDVAVLTSDNPRTELPTQIMNDVLEGCLESENIQQIEDRAKAIEWALSQAEPGDCVLIAGKGHETYQEIGTERIPFDDREIVKGWLEQTFAYQPYQQRAA